MNRQEKNKGTRSCFRIATAALLAVLMLAAVLVFTSSASTEDEKTKYLNSYRDIDLTLPHEENSAELQRDSFTAQHAGVMPAYYSSMDSGYVTRPKAQGIYGSCWSFAAMSAAESSLISQGKTVDGRLAEKSWLDLSEAHFAYFFYHVQNDPLGNYTGDANKIIGNYNFLTVGGNNAYGSLALASWIGAADESVAPYSHAVSITTYNPIISMNDLAHLQNFYWINMNDSDTVKEMIMEYGSVATAYFHDDSCYNEKTYGYFQNDETLTNHAVAVIGWDDSFSRNNFNTPAPVDGAWLIKNSWGTMWGESGCFWLSYADASIYNDDALAFVLRFEDGDNYDYNYQYDGTASASILSTFTDYSMYANNFTAKSGSLQRLRAVSVAMYSENVAYSVQVYKNSGEVPTSGTPLLSKPVTGTTSYTGYYTIPIDEKVILENGDKFSIVFTLYKPGGAIILTAQNSTNGWIDFVNNVSSGESAFAYQQEGTNERPVYDWITDGLYEEGITPRIKGFTDSVTTVSEELEGVSLSENSDYLRLYHEGTVYLVSDTGSFPPAVKIKNGKVEDCDYTYDSTKGIITIANVSGRVVISPSETNTPVFITLNAAGGTVTPGFVTAMTHTPVGELPEPTRGGYNFLGWKNIDDESFVGESTVFFYDTTLIAQWECAHSWSAPVVTEKPTEAHSGVCRYSCVRCGTVRFDDAPYLIGDIYCDLQLNGKDGIYMKFIIVGDMVWEDIAKGDLWKDGRIDGKDDNLLVQAIAGDYIPN